VRVVWSSCARIAAATLAAAAAIVVAGPAGAQQPPTAELEEARRHRDEFTAQEAAAMASLQQATARVADLTAQVGALDARIGEVTGQLAAAESRLAAAEAAVVAGQQRLEAARAALAATEERMVDQVVSVYVGGDTAFEVEQQYWSADTITAAQASRSYGQVVMRRQVSAIDERRLAEENAELEAAALAAARDQATVARDQVAAQRAELEGARAELAAVQQQAAAEEASRQALLGTVHAQRQAWEARVAELEAESRRIAELLAAAERQRAAAAAASRGGGGGGGGPPPPASLSTPLSNPLPRMVITSGFGWRRHPIYGSSRLHAGLDLDGDTGDPIYAAGGGVVVSAGWRGGYGNCVIIDHGGGFATLYGHMSSIGVSTGQVVSQGTGIGAIGSTGASTGPHLHFEVRIHGEPVNPVPYLPL
jgi:murein DD-endopeptidase MepM/ murein hydrolase activator NlpD